VSDCKTAQELIARRSLASLEALDESILSAHLAACPACQRRAERLARTLRGLGELGQTEVRPRPEARSRFLAAAAEARRPTGRRSSRALISRRHFLGVGRWRRPAFGYAAQGLVAAGLLLAAGLGLAHLRQKPDGRAAVSGQGGPNEPLAVKPDPELPRVEVASGTVMLERAGRSIKVPEGTLLAAADRLITDARARTLLRYPDRSFAEMNRNTAVIIGDGAGGKQLSLERGELFVKAAKQPAGRPMTLNPGRADQVLVVGTAFELARRDDRTRLRMIEGQVAFGPEARSVVVNAGQASSVEPGAAPAAPEPCEISTIAAWRHEDVAASTPAGGTKPDGSSPASPEGVAPVVVDPAAPTAPTAVAPGKVVVPGPGTGLPTPTPVTGDPDPPAGPKQPGPDPASPDKDKKDGNDGKDTKKPPEDRGRPVTKPTPPGKIGGPGPGGKPDKGGK